MATTRAFKPFMKRSSSGVTRIVRDSYFNKNTGTNWYEICKRVRTRDMHKCVDCGLPEDPKNGVNHDVHHVIPLSRGGTTQMLNLILLCTVGKNCHAKRHKHMR